MLNESGLSKGGGVSMTTPTARERAQQRVRIFDALEKLFFKIMRKSGDCDSVPAGRTKNDLLSLTHVGGEVFRTFKTFRVSLPPPNEWLPSRLSRLINSRELPSARNMPASHPFLGQLEAIDCRIRSPYDFVMLR
jgi:hypothetical protein